MRQFLCSLLFPLATPLPATSSSSPAISSAQPVCQTFKPDPLIPSPFRVVTKPWDHTQRPGGKIQVTKVYDCTHGAGATMPCPVDETYSMVLEMEPYIYVVGTGEYISHGSEDPSTPVATKEENSWKDTPAKNKAMRTGELEGIFNLVRSSANPEALSGVDFSSPVYYNFTLPADASKIDAGRKAYRAFSPFQSCFSGALSGCIGDSKRFEEKKISVCGYLFEDEYGMGVKAQERRYQGRIDQLDVELTAMEVQEQLTWVCAEDFDWTDLDASQEASPPDQNSDINDL